MMTGSNTVTVSATLPAAVVYHTQAIESDAVANYEMQEAEQTSLLSFPENSAGISTQTVIETRCENKQNDDLHPAISSGDFGRIVKLKSERNLTLCQLNVFRPCTLCQLNVFRPCRMRVCTLLTRVTAGKVWLSLVM